MPLQTLCNRNVRHAVISIEITISLPHSLRACACSSSRVYACTHKWNDIHAGSVEARGGGFLGDENKACHDILTCKKDERT